MAKEETSNLRNIEGLIEQVEFKPSETQRKTKAKLAGVLANNPIYNQDDLTPDMIAKITGDRRIYKWVKEDPQALEYFRNKNEFRQRLEHLIEKALDRAESILDNDSERALGPQVNMMKILFELGNRFPSRAKETRYLDDEVNRMSEEQLVKYIERHMKKAIPIRPLELEAEASEEEGLEEELGEGEE